jgi:hypothetical protein
MTLTSHRFLLAVFQLRYVLSEKEPRKVVMALKTLPKSPEDAYVEIFKRIDPKAEDWVYKIVSWLFHAKRSLFMDELRHALAVEPFDVKLEEDYLPEPDNVIESCQSLVIHDKETGIVRFAHYTVQEFIQCNCTQHLLPIVEVAKTCLTYLGFDAFNEGPCRYVENFALRQSEYKFFRYAAEYWGVHCRGDTENNLDVQQLILKFLVSDNKRNSMIQMENNVTPNCMHFGKHVFVKGQTFLHIIAGNGLARICTLVFDGGSNACETYLLTVAITVN